MILVVTLAIVVLLTVVVLAFFSHATLNRQVEGSRTNRSEAELLARTGEDYVAGRFLSEISDPNHSRTFTTNGVSLYFPLSATNSLVGRRLGPGVPMADTNFFNLVRQSAPAADPNASANSTAAAARNGRFIATGRWNAPQFLSGAGFAQTNQLPNWIYVTRAGGITNTPSGDVIGRFAYNVYDTGGLLDITAAGYPGAATNISALKGTLAGADLTQLPGLTQSAVDNLVAWRNPGASASAYAAAVNAFAENGFFSPTATNPATGQVFTNNAFVNRGDLLRYARTQNPALTNALPYLTTFSRSINAPSWTPPVSPANTNPNIPDVRFSSGGTVTHYRDNGATESYSVKAGDPLVQRRFSLARLSWLTPTGPATGISEEAIQACFGLKWNDSQERWDYVGSTGSVPQSTIKTLAEAASESAPREPNFFEVLKAGILDGTIGGHAVSKFLPSPGLCLGSICGDSNMLLDSNKDLHILQIGANIIDCGDRDNYPTILALTYEGIAIERAGIEDLPYFYSLDLANIRVTSTSSETVTTPSGTKSVTKYTISDCDFVWVPELLNPHRPSTASESPNSIQIAISGGSLRQAGFTEGGGITMQMGAGNLAKDLSTLPPITVTASDFENFRSGPQPVRGATANSLGALAPSVDASQANVLGFGVYSYRSPESGTTTLPFNTNNGNYMAAIQVSRLVVDLRYQTPSGDWKTYSTLGGSASLPDTGIDGAYRDDMDVPILKHSDMLSNLPSIRVINSLYLLPWDPRGYRFGPVLGRSQRALAKLPEFYYRANYDWFPNSPYPFYPNTYFDVPKPPVGGTAFVGNLPQMIGFQDPDGQARPPDANIGFAAPGTTPTAANPYKNLTDYTPRPVVLQRPYQSVAELGYVFRDVPWQTLDFFNDKGGDAALLDLFSVTEQPAVTVGCTSLNTPHSSIQKALLSQTGQLSDGTSPLATGPIAAVASAFSSYSFPSGLPSSTVSQNVADLPKFMASAGVAGAGLDAIKYRREAVVRALGVTQTRTWNLFVDLIAQSGRFPGGNFSPGDFVVEGENRSWTSIAIDRYTGAIVDRATENINE